MLLPLNLRPILLFSVALFSIFFTFPLFAAEKTVASSECVILLHGLARTSSSMDKMEEKLTAQGFAVKNVDYPSRYKKIEELADIAVNEGLDFCRNIKSPVVHFVTHSLGGILVRYYLSGNTISELGRVVMMAPPNQGSNVVDTFSQLPGYEMLNGPAGFQLGKDENSIPLQLGPANFEVGVIAGDRTINLILSTSFDEPNDGKVAVEDTKLEGMKDFLVVHHSHPFIMESNEVLQQTLYFLQYGKFKKN